MLEDNEYIQPLGRRVLIKVKAEKTTTDSGLEVPEDVADARTYGSIRGTIVGMGKNAFPEDYGHAEIGDDVVFIHYAGQLISLERDDRVIQVNDKDVTAVIKKRLNKENKSL